MIVSSPTVKWGYVRGQRQIHGWPGDGGPSMDPAIPCLHKGHILDSIKSVAVFSCAHLRTHGGPSMTHSGSPCGALAGFYRYTPSLPPGDCERHSGGIPAPPSPHVCQKKQKRANETKEKVLFWSLLGVAKSAAVREGSGEPLPWPFGPHEAG